MPPTYRHQGFDKNFLQGQRLGNLVVYTSYS
eukprot:CAMPEP_0172536398 /NCGR_PEP_ID=MMETSP1067-20121228/8167_1 /TAXON_ID=265564 ORGANISM="Thalassiosira punctigera, Strain Tpunct2005C2" /NCGR_SAMPLE_ID=MMETSP1067 /ASSEMBLY_ACC=CAM_ASM_000444 /LENGTH=30 /DNA_ID= /DNA_START= /DNA_END= /DNA_ORIENTATION=